MADLFGFSYPTETFPEALWGDPDELEADGTLYSRLADEISDAIYAIGDLGNADFRSDAISALQKNQGDVASKITRIQYRYWMAGGALTTYADALRQAQAQAAVAAAHQGDAGQRIPQLENLIRDLTQAVQSGGPDQQQQLQELQHYRAELLDLQQQQADAMQLWNDAKAAKDEAAKTARIAIHVGDEANDLNDSFWDALADVARAVTNALTEIVDFLAEYMSYLAAILSVLSFIFPVLAPLAALAWAATTVLNVSKAVLAVVSFFLDGFNLTDLLLVGIGVAATFGAGLVASAAGDLAESAAETGGRALSSLTGDATGKVAGDAVGVFAKFAAKQGIKDLAALGVDQILDQGSNEAKDLFEKVEPGANDFLNTQLSGTVHQFKMDGADIGKGDLGKVDFDISQMQNPSFDEGRSAELPDFTSSSGPGVDQYDSALGGPSDFQKWMSDPHGLGSFTNGDVQGDQLGNVAQDWAGAASRGHWGGAAQTVVNAIGDQSAGHFQFGNFVTGALTDYAGDQYGNIQDAQRANVVAWNHQTYPGS